MKKFILINIFILMASLSYSDQEIDNLNNLLKNANVNVIDKNTITQPKIDAKTNQTENTNIKNTEFFKQPDKKYINDTLIGLNNLFEKSSDFAVISEYIDLNIKKVDKNIADEMIMMYEKYYYSIPLSTEIFIEDEQLIDKKFSSLILEEAKKYNNDYTELIKNYNSIENVELKDFLKSLYTRNLSLTYSNRYFYFTVNYDRLQTYSEYLTSDMLSYLKYSDNEIRHPAAANSQIIIPISELIDRILIAENAISKSNNKELNKEFSKMLVFHFENLLLGVADTPVFNYDTKHISNDFLTSYKSYISKNGVFKSDMEKFLNDLSKENYNKTPQTYGEQIKFFNKITSYYNLSKDETFQ